MKLWGWWRKDEPEVAKPQAGVQTLDDLPPKFNDPVDETIEARERVRPSLRKVMKSITAEDFKAMPQVPCFRTAMLTGMGMSVVAGSVIFIARRSLSRAANWMCGGFVVGSVITWEQCRFRMMRGKRNVQQAQEVWRQKGDDFTGRKPT